jgi:hypothetical protein
LSEGCAKIKLKSVIMWLSTLALTMMPVMAANDNSSSDLIPSWGDGVNLFLSTPIGSLAKTVILFMAGLVVAMTVIALFTSQGHVTYGVITDKAKHVIAGRNNGILVSVCFIILVVLLAMFKWIMNLSF